jgi:hypothetical protein
MCSCHGIQKACPNPVWSRPAFTGLRNLLHPDIHILQTQIYSCNENQQNINQTALLLKKLWGLVFQRTIPTERPPLVGEVSANFSGYRVSRGQRNESPRPLIFPFSRPKPLLSFQIAPQLSSRGWVDPVPDPLLLRKSGRAGNQTRDLRICSQELWPLDHRHGPALLF